MKEKKYYAIEFSQRSDDLNSINLVIGMFSGERAYNMTPELGYVSEPYGTMTLSQAKSYYDKGTPIKVVTSKNADQLIWDEMVKLNK